MNETKAAHVLLGRLEKLAEKLPPRDLNVLRDIEARRYMTTGQIRRLRFTGTGTPTSDKNVTYRTLNRLKGHGLIVPLDKRIGGVRSGSSETVWALSPLGWRILHLDEDGQPRKRVFEPSWRFAKHTLATTEIDVRFAYCVVRIFFANLKRGGIMLIQIAVGSLYLFSVPRGYSDGFWSWAKQVAGLCLTAFLQTTLLFLGLLTFPDHMLLAMGIMLSATEVPRVAGHFGLETGARFNVSSVMYLVNSGMSLIRTLKK